MGSPMNGQRQAHVWINQMKAGYMQPISWRVRAALAMVLGWVYYQTKLGALRLLSWLLRVWWYWQYELLSCELSQTFDYLHYLAMKSIIMQGFWSHIGTTVERQMLENTQLYQNMLGLSTNQSTTICCGISLFAGQKLLTDKYLCYFSILAAWKS